MKLEKQVEQETTEEDDWTIYWLSLTLVLILIFGFVFELVRQKRIAQA